MNCTYCGAEGQVNPYDTWECEYCGCDHTFDDQKPGTPDEQKGLELPMDDSGDDLCEHHVPLEIPCPPVPLSP